MMMLLSATLLGFGSVASAATDYSHYSDSELAGLRGTLRNAPVEERIAYHREWEKRLAELGSDPREHFKGPSENKGYHYRQNRLKEILGLNDSQSAKVKELHEKHFSLVVVERTELVALNRELQAESFKVSPDRKKIEGLSEKIGKQHASLARLKSNYLTELASILTPAQRVKLQTLRDARQLRAHYSGKFE